MTKLLTLAAVVALASAPFASAVKCDRTYAYSAMRPVLAPCRNGRAWLKSCDQKCAPAYNKFWKNISKCHNKTSLGARLHSSSTLSALAKSCKGLGNSKNKTSCSTRSTFSLMLQCTKFMTEALKDGKLSPSDHFCQSTCYRLTVQNQACKSRGSAAVAQMIKVLSASDKSCAVQNGHTVGKGSATAVMAKINTNCATQSATALTKGACRGKCLRTIRYGMGNSQYVPSIRKMPVYTKLHNVISYCNANRTNTHCKSSKNMALNQVMKLCCGKGAKKCAKGHLPSNCTSSCNGAFLPYYSTCGRTVFKGTQLRSMISFARTCAKQNGRYVPSAPSANLNGPNPRDPCSHITNCTRCRGKCGWCRNEVQSKASLRAHRGGWCSSICQTSRGECKGRIGFGAATQAPMGEVGRQCFDHVDNDGKKDGTDCADCDCIHQFRAYCTRKNQISGVKVTCSRGSGKGGKGSGKGGKGSGKGGSGKGFRGL